MVASSLVAVVSMRLVRTLCPRCRESYEVNASNLNRLGARDLGSGTVTLSRGRGCSHCRDTGYHGRTGIYEVLEVNDAIRGLISQGASDASIRAVAVENGMRSIGEDGLKKVLSGRTTLEEVTRVVYLAESGAKLCGSCDAVLAKDYEYCPNCGDYVGDHCEHCKHRLDGKWTFCPHCGESTGLAPEAAADGSAEAATGERRRRPRLRRAS
jgi:predicted RNA-binding Zn-ribbon protein involved in translation (DUF1610 family)